MAQAKRAKLECLTKIACDGNMIFNGAEMCGECARVKKKRERQMEKYRRLQNAVEGKPQNA